MIVVEAGDLDEARATAGELQELRPAGVIGVRPIRDEQFNGA